MAQIALERPTDLAPPQPARPPKRAATPADDAPALTSLRRWGGPGVTGGTVAVPSAVDTFAVVYRANHDAVAAAARRICGPHHAVDVTQEVFLVLARHPERFDPARGSLRSFLMAIAHHRAVDLVRSEKARQLREARVDSLEPLAPADVDEDLLRSEGRTQVRAALAELPAPEREAITAAFYGRCSYREAAAKLGQPEGTVKSRIRTGFQRLRPMLTPVDAGLAPSPSRI